MAGVILYFIDRVTKRSCNLKRNKTVGSNLVSTLTVDKLYIFLNAKEKNKPMLYKVAIEDPRPPKTNVRFFVESCFKHALLRT